MKNPTIITLTELGDAVAATKGTAMIGTVDPFGGYRKGAGLSNAD